MENTADNNERLLNDSNESWQSDKEDQFQDRSADGSTQNLRDRDEDEDEDDDVDGEEEPKKDWGSVDPQEHPGLSTDMDPSGPGSAV